MSAYKIEAGTAQHIGSRPQQNDRTALFTTPKAPGYVLAVLADGVNGLCRKAVPGASRTPAHTSSSVASSSPRITVSKPAMMYAAALSVAKLPYDQAQDGISLTASITPTGLGRTPDEQVTNLVGVLDAYTDAGGFHLNANVLNRETLLDAMAHPENHPQLTIRVSGYAVNFIRLTPEQQRDVVNRTFHESL